MRDLNISDIEPEIFEIIKKIDIIPDESMEDTKAGIRGANVCLKCMDGTVYQSDIKIPKGDAANPFTVQELHRKLAVCADGVITDEQQNFLISFVESFENIEKYYSINTFLMMKGNENAT